MTDTWVNIGSGPFNAPKPWLNLDVIFNDTIKPDVVVKSASHPLRGIDNITRVMAGHVFEHIRWEFVPEFTQHIYSSLKPGGQLLVVGPDVERALKLWRLDNLDWPTLLATMEGYAYVDPATQEVTVPLWEGARHAWNCTEERLRYSLSQFFESVVPQPIQSNFLDDWPITSRAGWQCAVLATKAEG